MVLVISPRQIRYLLLGPYSVALHYSLAPNLPTRAGRPCPTRQAHARLGGEGAGELVFRGNPQSVHSPPVLEKFSDASDQEQPAEQERDSDSRLKHLNNIMCLVGHSFNRSGLGTGLNQAGWC